MELLILLAILWILVFINWFRFRDVLYPAFLQSLLWAGVISLFCLLQNDFVPVSNVTWSVIGSGVIGFSLGVFTSTCGHSPFRERNIIEKLPSGLATYFLIVVSLGCLPIVIMKAKGFFVKGPFVNGFVNLRYAMSAREGYLGGYGVFNYIVPIIFFASGSQLIRMLHKKTIIDRMWGFLALLIGLFYGVLTSGRGIIVLFICIVFFIPLVLRRINPVRSFFVLILSIIFVFVSLGILVGKGGSLGASVTDNFATMAKSGEIYLLGSLPALDYQIKFGPSYGLSNFFRTIFAILNAFGFDVHVVPLVKNFIMVPYPTNIYTVHQPYFLDFGLFSIPVFQFVFGMFHGVLYRKATIFRPHAISVFFFSLFMFPLLLQFGTDCYFSLLSLWIQYFIMSVVFFVFIDGRSKEKGFA